MEDRRERFERPGEQQRVLELEAGEKGGGV